MRGTTLRGTTLKAVAGAITLALLAAGCSSHTPTTVGGDSTYVMSFSLAEPQFLLPTNANESSGNQVLSALSGRTVQRTSTQ